MKSRLKKMALVTADEKLKEIPSKNCKNCNHYHAFKEEYIGDCDYSRSTTMMNDYCKMHDEENQSGIKKQ